MSKHHVLENNQQATTSKNKQTMATPVVVQGTAVAAPYPTQSNVGFGGPVEVSGPGATQEPAKTGCKDPLFALLFYLNVGAIAAVAVIYGLDAISGENASTYLPYLYAMVVFGGISFVLSGVGLLMLMACPALMIKAGLIFSVLVTLAWTVYMFMIGSFIYGAFAALLLLFTLCYVKYVWSRIPFAAVNLLTAGTAIKANLGVTIFAIFFTLLLVGWLILWSFAIAGIADKTTVCNDNGACSPNYGLLFGMFLALFFTQQVLQSCVHVTVAGTVGTWWVAPNESGCCSRGVCNSFIRTITTSFGSICFGSLLVAILQALRALASTARQNDDCAILACIMECILDCLASLLEYFNKWAFIYVGVYGYGYIESGKAVMQLFANRGWEAIIADDLVGGAIFLICVMIGLIVGGIGVGYAQLDPNYENLTQNSILFAFLVGFIAGLIISAVLLSTISSGVNTVIVMFADAPQEFQTNHPELSAKMRATWQEFYPSSIQ